MKQGQNTGFCDIEHNPIKVGDKIKTIDGSIFIISPYGSALDANREAWPLRKICETQSPIIWNMSTDAPEFPAVEAGATKEEKEETKPAPGLDALSTELEERDYDITPYSPELSKLDDGLLVEVLRLRGWTVKCSRVIEL